MFLSDIQIGGGRGRSNKGILSSMVDLEIKPQSIINYHYSIPTSEIHQKSQNSLPRQFLPPRSSCHYSDVAMIVTSTY